MSVIYAMSDIHGCVKEFEAKLRLTDLGGNNRLILLGDYIDYGHQSGRVLQTINNLQHPSGQERVRTRVWRFLRDGRNGRIYVSGLSIGGETKMGHRCRGHVPMHR